MDAIVETQNMLKAAIFKKKAKKVRLQDLLDLLSHNNMCFLFNNVCFLFKVQFQADVGDASDSSFQQVHNKLVVPRKNHSV